MGARIYGKRRWQTNEFARDFRRARPPP